MNGLTKRSKDIPCSLCCRSILISAQDSTIIGVAQLYSCSMQFWLCKLLFLSHAKSDDKLDALVCYGCTFGRDPNQIAWAMKGVQNLESGRNCSQIKAWAFTLPCPRKGPVHLRHGILRSSMWKSIQAKQAKVVQRCSWEESHWQCLTSRNVLTIRCCSSRILKEEYLGRLLLIFRSPLSDCCQFLQSALG